MNLSFGNRISAHSWNQALESLATHRRLDELDGPEGRPRKLDIDLSAAGFADFIILGRILILVATAALKDISVTVRLPSQGFLIEERAALRRIALAGNVHISQQHNVIAQRRRQRIACLLFIRQAGFESALQSGPLSAGQVRILSEEDEQAELAPPTDSDFPDFGEIALPQAPLRHRRIAPYRWLEATPQDSVAEVKFLEAEIAELGVHGDDSYVLADEVIDELVQNVRDHAANDSHTQPPSLLGLIVHSASSLPSQVEDSDPSLHDLLLSAFEVRSPIIRLLVGDAGAGFAVRAPTPNSSTQDHSSAKSTQIAILSALDTWTQTSSEQLPIRGLWKLDRIIDSYCGAFVIASRGAVAGHAFDRTVGRRTVEALLPSNIGGTIAECAVPALPGRLRRIHQSQRPAHSAALIESANASLPCASFSLSPDVALDPGEISAANELLPSARDGLVVAAEAPKGYASPSPAEVESFISEVLDLGARVAEVVPVAIAFAGINRTVLDVAIADYNKRSDKVASASAGLTNTFLVVTSEGAHYWLGGPPTVRHVFDILSTTNQVISLDDLPSVDDRLIHQLSYQNGLRQHAGSLSLKLAPEIALASLMRHFRERLGRAVRAANSDGVESGTFLTPGLRFTSRWIDVRDLLTSLRCGSTASMLLAAGVVARLGAFLDMNPQVTILRVGSISRDLVATFALSISGSESYLDDLNEISQAAQSPDLSRSTIIICTDLVSTTHAVRKTAQYALSLGAQVLAIAAVFDARPADQREFENAISVDGIKVPLITLASIDVSASHPIDKSYRVIDPIIRAPTAAISPRVRVPIDQADYLSALGRRSAVRLGHMSRAGGRHYTAYADATMLWRDALWADIALGFMLKTIRAARVDRATKIGKPCPVVIIFPRRTRDNIADVAEMLADRLENVAKIDVVDTLQVQRAMLDGKWIFPAALALPKGPLHVVILDPACRTGQATRQMIRLASGPDVIAITAFALLNGMSESDALAIQQVRSVEPFAPDSGRAVSGVAIPVDVHFLARTAVARIPAERCPICKLRSSYAALPKVMPKELANYRDVLLATLTARTKDEIYANSVPIDIFGITIQSTDCISYLTWRSLLNDAVHNTLKRKELADSLQLHLRHTDDAEDDVARSARIESTQPNATPSPSPAGLVRLIAAESNWLDVAPLSYQHLSEMVGELAAKFVHSSHRSELQAMFRCQAVIVLAAADPARFAQDIIAVIRNSADHSQVCCQVLLEILRLLQAPQTTSSVMSELMMGLVALEDLTREPEPPPYIAPDIHLYRQVRFLATMAKRRVAKSPEDPVLAWSMLRSRYLSAVTLHEYDQPIWRVLLRLRNLLRGVNPSNPDAGNIDWLRCSDSLAVEVLANLRPLSPIFLSTRIPHVTDADAQHWERVISGDGQAMLDSITVRLAAVFDHSAESVDYSQVSDLIREIEWWSDYFFSAPVHDDSPMRDAVLVSTLKECPARLFPVLETTFEDTDHEILQGEVPRDHATSVFCPADLLSDVLMHIKHNAQYTSRVPEMDQHFMLSVSRDGPDHLMLTIMNSASDAAISRGRGRGLAKFADELEVFGASLQPEEPPVSMTYAISLRLRRWKATW